MTLVDDLLDEWRANGATVLVATHAADRFGPRIDGWMRLEHGLLVEVGGAGVDGRTARAPRPRRPTRGAALPAGAR